MKKLVAFIHPDLGIGGAERLVLDVASALTLLNYEIIFITNHFDKNHAFEELKRGDYPVQVYGDWIPRSIFGKFQALCAYIRMIYLTIIYLLFIRKRDKPDIYFVDLIPISVPFLRLFNEKTVYYCHHPDLLASKPGGVLKRLYRKPINWLEMRATGLANSILVNSEYTATIFHETFPQISNSIQVIYPTVAPSYAKAVKEIRTHKTINEIISSETEIEVGSNSVVFLSLNRYHPAKQVDLVVKALDKLRSSLTETDWKRIYLIIAGGYDPQSFTNFEYYSKLLSLTKDLDLEKKVVFLKSPNDQLKTELLLACDCLVYTPVNEHFGIVPLEAMVAGKPVIACNSGGPRETIEHAINGYLCEPNPASMAQFMRRILDKDNSKEMGLKGKLILQERFSYEHFLKSLESVFEKLL